jgi:hypothetical protein
LFTFAQIIINYLLMKKLILLLFLLTAFTSVNKAQSFYCGGICISNLSIPNDSIAITVMIDSIEIGVGHVYYNVTRYYHWLKISMYGINVPDTINYPTLVVINTANNDTIGNNRYQSYSFQQYADSTVTDSVLTLLDSIPFNFHGEVLLIDKLAHDTCNYFYPMSCTNTGIHQFATETNSLTVFPNPSANTVNIDLGDLHHQLSIINIYDDKGELIKTITTSNSISTFNSDNLSNGIYFITADIGSRRLNSKLIISH